VNNNSSPQQFTFWVTSPGRGFNNTVQLSDICQQDIVITDASGKTVFTQPPFSGGQPPSCMCAHLPAPAGFAVPISWHYHWEG
jgi:hypothetical protein